MENKTDEQIRKETIIVTICVAISYIVMYGLLMLFASVLDSSTPACLVFLVICFIFAFKSCKGALNQHLSNLPWPVFLVVLVMLSAVIGCFTAPYHIGKWIAQLINDAIN